MLSQHAQRRRLAGAVAPDDPDRLPRLHAKVDAGERLHAVLRPAAAGDELLERAPAVADGERAPGVLEEDLAGPHSTTASSPSARAKMARPASTTTAVAAAM